MATIRSMAALEVKDLALSHAFYKGLGFGTLGIWSPEEPHTIIVQRGDVTLMMQGRANPAVPGEISAYIYVDDCDALHADLTAKGVTGLTPPDDMFYGCREFSLRDPDGHRVVFGADKGNPPHINGLGPDRGDG